MDDERDLPMIPALVPSDTEALMITGLVPDRSGLNAFVVVIREEHDPG